MYCIVYVLEFMAYHLGSDNLSGRSSLEKTNPFTLSNHCFPVTIHLGQEPSAISTIHVDKSVGVVIIQILPRQQMADSEENTT